MTGKRLVLPEGYFIDLDKLALTGKYIKQPDGQFIWVDGNESVYTPAPENLPAGSANPHNCWRFDKYVGFTDVYDYCSDCGKKKPKGYGMIDPDALD